MEKEKIKGFDDVNKKGESNAQEPAMDYEAFCEMMDEIEKDILPDEGEITFGE